MADIFLSYRRNDAPGFAGRLAEDLEAALGAGSVFRDVDDLRLGQDFVGVIKRELGSVGVALVMIGPGWLEARAGVEVENKRRLDDLRDYVRLEVVAALASGKPVIPLLVNGATLPREADLPEALRALSRRQAFCLSDANWKADVVRLLADIRPLLPRRGGAWRRRWPWLLGAGLALALGFAWWAGPPAPSGSEATLPAVDLAGRRSATVKYDWGAEHRETFEFQVRGDQVNGSASFLRLPRSIEEGRLDGGRLSFATRSDEVLGDAPPREVIHRYRGEVEGNAIRFTLASTGGYSRHPPLAFVARRGGE